MDSWLSLYHGQRQIARTTRIIILSSAYVREPGNFNQLNALTYIMNNILVYLHIL